MNSVESIKTQPTMVTDQEIARGVETVLRQADPSAQTSLYGVVQQLEARLGLDLSHKAEFIKDQITILLGSHPVSPAQLPQYQIPRPSQQFFQQHSHFAPQQQQDPTRLHPRQDPTRLHHQPVAAAFTPPPQTQPPLADQNAAANAPQTAKGRAPAGTKRRGGPGGLNKVCGVSPELQAIVGEPALPRTEIVKKLWAYIRKHSLQDPGNKRKIICDDALRVVFEVDSTDMFKMNKLLAKHILTLDSSKQPVQAKKLKVEDESTKQSPDTSLRPVIISDALAKFFGTGEREILQAEALSRVWEYIKVNQLEDPLNSMVIHCDAKLQELLGCESISALGIQEMLVRHHLLKQ